MTDASPPFAEIYRDNDRTWSLRIVEWLARSLSEDDLERARLARSTLLSLGDHRTYAPLQALLVDDLRPGEVRRLAGKTLADLGAEIDPALLRSWWAGPDPLLQREVLRHGDEMSGIVEQVASDPIHPLYRESIGAMAFGFEMPHHQELKLLALHHGDPEVRETAADVLIWDEPLIAQEALIDATCDSKKAVAEAACNTLKYYPTLATLRCLEGRRHWKDDAAEAADHAYWDLRADFANVFRYRAERVNERIRSWLAPLWKRLDFSKEELEPEDSDLHCRPPLPPLRPSAAMLLGLIGDPEVPLQNLHTLWRQVDWRTYRHSERRDLQRALVDHLDPTLRMLATRPLSIWGEVEPLMGLVTDSYTRVRKAAIYRLGLLDRKEPRVSEVAWEYLQRRDVTGVQAWEALSTCISHLPRVEAIPLLVGVTRDTDLSDGLRRQAVGHLECLQARRALQALLPLLHEEPPVTWTLHLGLLTAAESLRLDPGDVTHLAGVDDLYVQQAIAPFVG